MVLAFVVGMLFLGLQPIADGDIWWHLAAGRRMVQTRGLLLHDPFSLGAAGRPWIDVHWLFQLAAYGVYSLGGNVALVVGKSILTVLGALFLLWAVYDGAQVVRRNDALPWLLGTVIALLSSLFVVRHLLLVRPTIATLGFLAVFFFVLERHRTQGRGRVLLWLPILQIPWANMQGLSALGPALLGAYALHAFVHWRLGRADAQPFVTLGVVTLLCVLGGLVTPFGWSGLLLPLRLLARLAPSDANVFSANVAENIPPLTLDSLAPGSFWHFKYALAILAGSFVLARRRLVVAHLVVALMFTGLALMANRNVLLMYWLCAPLVVINIGTSPFRDWFTRHRRQGLSFGVLILVSLNLLAVMAWAREPSLAQPTPFRFPTESARRLIDPQIPAGRRIFAAAHFGGYLIWALYPSHRPFMDTRTILRTSAEFDEYLGLLQFPERFDSFAGKHQLDTVILPTGFPDRYLGLIQQLYKSATWRLVFSDGNETMFLRVQPSPDPLAMRLPTLQLGTIAAIDTVLGDLHRRFGDQPHLEGAARLQFGKLLLLLSHGDMVARALGVTTGHSTASGIRDNPTKVLLALARLSANDLKGASELALNVLAQDAQNVGALMLMAHVDLRRGAPHQALDWLRRALVESPADPEALGLLQQLETAARSF